MGRDSYISPFVHSYNPQLYHQAYSPCIIGIIFHELRSKYMRKQAVDFNTTMNTRREKIFNVFPNQLMSLHSMVTITIAIKSK